MPSSKPSLTCRIDWVPSRALAAGVTLLACLAVVAAWSSALPAWAAGLGSVAAVGHALIVLRRLRAAVPLTLSLGEQGDATLNFPDGAQSLTGCSLAFRGPLATLAGAGPDGRRRRLLWWPDTLPSAARRQLHLVAGRLPSESPTVLPPGY